MKTLEKLRLVKETLNYWLFIWLHYCLSDYNYFNTFYEIIAIDLSKQQALDADPEAIQPSSFYGNLENNAVIFFIIEEVKEAVLDFSRWTVEVLQFCFCVNIKWLNIRL